MLNRPPTVSGEADIFQPLKSSIDRPKSTMYPETNRSHRPHLRGLSQSSHNLNAAGLSANLGGKGRSKSRLRLPFSRGNLASAGDEIDLNDRESPSNTFGIFRRLPKEVWPDCKVSMSVMVRFKISKASAV